MRALKRAALVIAITSCALYDSSLLIDASAPDATPADSGADVVVDPCDHAEPPTRPSADDPSDASDIELVTAVTNVDFGGDGGTTLGFDLDHTCTCPGPESCVPGQGGNGHCDDSRGRDNAGGALIQEFSELTTQLSTAKINTNFENGVDTMVIRVRQYNGTANDTQVALAVFVSTGTVPLDDAGANPIPKHDGTDMWGLDPSSVVGTPPPYVAVNEDTSAYVTNGVLVGSVSFPFRVGNAFGPNFLRLDGAFLVATLAPSGSGYAMSGVITGRWDTRNLLTGMQGIHDPLVAGQYLCGTDSTYQGFKSAICAAADIASLASSDNTGAPCDALSLAVGFTSEPAMLGGLLPAGTPPSPCGATYSDQCGN
jgi:hypothetical protein